MPNTLLCMRRGHSLRNPGQSPENCASLTVVPSEVDSETRVAMTGVCARDEVLVSAGAETMETALRVLHAGVNFAGNCGSCTMWTRCE